MPGDAALAAFASCAATPTKDHHLDVHVDVMRLLRPHTERCEGKPFTDVPALTAEWTTSTIAYVSECRGELATKGIADQWVEPTITLRDWLKEATISLKASNGNGKAQDDD